MNYTLLLHREWFHVPFRNSNVISGMLQLIPGMFGMLQFPVPVHFESKILQSV